MQIIRCPKCKKTYSDRDDVCSEGRNGLKPDEGKVSIDGSKVTVAAKELSQAAANMEVDDKSNLSPGKESLSVLSSSPATTDNNICYNVL